MKKTVLIASCLILSVVSVFQTNQSKEPLDELILMNVEALAAPEYNDERWMCKGIGETECPNGVKVKMYIPDYYSLR